MKLSNKIEVGFIPRSDLFGLNCEAERGELMSILEGAGVTKVNFDVPRVTDDESKKLLTDTVKMADDFYGKGFSLSMRGIDVKAMQDIREIWGNSISKVAFFTNDGNSPEIADAEKYCIENNIPYVPSCSGYDDIAKRVGKEKQKTIKAFHWIDAKGDGVNQIMKNVKIQKVFTDYGVGVLAAGGIKPVEILNANYPCAAPYEITEHFKDVAKMDCVKMICASHPVKTFLHKETAPPQNVEKFAQYFDIINEYEPK